MCEDTLCESQVIKRDDDKVAFKSGRLAQCWLCLQGDNTPVGTTKKPVKQIPVCVYIYVCVCGHGSFV